MGETFDLVILFFTSAFSTLTVFASFAEISPFEDGDFTIEKFIVRYNADLANGLGNLVSRVATLLEKDAITLTLTLSPRERGLEERINKGMRAYQFNNALKILWDVLRAADETLSRQKPWEIKDLAGKKKILEPVAQDILNVAELLQPFLPDTAEKIIKQFSAKQIKKSEGLFPRI